MIGCQTHDGVGCTPPGVDSATRVGLSPGDRVLRLLTLVVADEARAASLRERDDLVVPPCAPPLPAQRRSCSGRQLETGL
eukprot:COSAG01_NODE_30004_length_625_cov_1.038023_1_plen_80_part_00